MPRRRFHLDRAPELPWVECKIVTQDTVCTVCSGPLEFVGTGADSEIHECMHCGQQHQALENVGRNPPRVLR